MSAINLPRSPLARLASRWGRATVQITTSHLISQVIGIANTILLTYFLTLRQFGHYALALFLASMLTHIINAGLLQGAFMTVFGAGGDDDDDVDDDNEGALVTEESFDRRRFLTSALVLTCLIATFWVVLSIALQHPVGHSLFHRPGFDDLVVLGALSGGVSAIWRFSVNLLRVERRIMGYCVCRTLRPAGVFIATAVLMPLTNGGVRAALIALIGGTVLSLIPILVMTRRSYRFAVHPHDFTLAMRHGMPYIPITLFSGFVHSSGVFLLSSYRGAADVGAYSVASSMSSVNAHYISGFLTSFSPIKRTSIYAAARQHAQRFRAGVISTFMVTSLLLYVAVALLANELIRVSPNRYAGAAAVVPYALLGWTGYGFFMVMYRLSEFPHRRKIYIALSALSVALYVGLSALLDPRMGARGQGTAMGLTYLAIGVIVLAVSQRGPEPLPVDFTRLLGGAGLAAVCVVGFLHLADAVPAARFPIEAAGVLAFAGGVTLFRILPRDTVLALSRAIRQMIPRRDEVTRVQEGIERLEPQQALVLRSLGRPQSPAVQAASHGMSEREFELRAVAGMRELAGLGGPRACDMRIGAYLLSPKSQAERDVLARRLREEIDPGEIDMLESTVRLVRIAARREDRQRRGRRAHRRRPAPIPNTTTMEDLPVLDGAPVVDHAALSADPRIAEPVRPAALRR